MVSNGQQWKINIMHMILEENKMNFKFFSLILFHSHLSFYIYDMILENEKKTILVIDVLCTIQKKRERISAETNENLFQFHIFTGFPLLMALFFFTFSFWMLMMIAIRERTRAIVLRIKHVNVMQSIWGEGWGLVNYILFMKTKQKKNDTTETSCQWQYGEIEKMKKESFYIYSNFVVVIVNIDERIGSI